MSDQALTEDDCVVKCARLREVHEVLEDLVRAFEGGAMWPAYERAKALLGEIKKGEG